MNNVKITQGETAQFTLLCRKMSDPNRAQNLTGATLTLKLPTIDGVTQIAKTIGSGLTVTGADTGEVSVSLDKVSDTPNLLPGELQTMVLVIDNADGSRFKALFEKALTVIADPLP